MVVIELQHSTNVQNAGSIARWGLRARKPFDHNWKNVGFCKSQPVGVYCLWHDPDQPPWRVMVHKRRYRVHWCGPLIHDPLIREAVVIPEHVPPTCLQVTKRN